MAKKSKKATSPEDVLLSDIRTGSGRGRRRLSNKDRDTLIQMLAIKVSPDAFDVHSLAPPGSFIARMLRHFDATDISYALPLMQTIMLTASWLTQNGAYVEVPGLGQIKP